jgi:hypothetical protein
MTDTHKKEKLKLIIMEKGITGKGYTRNCVFNQNLKNKNRWKITSR